MIHETVASDLEEKLKEKGISAEVTVTEGQIFCVSEDPDQAEKILEVWLEPEAQLFCEAKERTK